MDTTEKQGPRPRADGSFWKSARRFVEFPARVVIGVASGVAELAVMLVGLLLIPLLLCLPVLIIAGVIHGLTTLITGV